MPAFDPRSLVGQSFASVLDEIGEWRRWGIVNGCRDGPPIDGRSETEAEVDRAFAERLAPIMDALRGNTLRLVDATGATLPLVVWFARRWCFNCDARRDICRLVTTDAYLHINAEYFNPVFALPEGVKSKAGNKAYEGDKEIARGIEIARANGLNWSKAARDLFKEQTPMPAAPSDRPKWEDALRRYERRMRTKLSEAYYKGGSSR